MNKNAKKIYDKLLAVGYEAKAACGILGNICAESGYNSHNLQGTYEHTLNMTDDTYTAAVDDGTYTLDDFKSDKAGYGLAQWTYFSRKERLYKYIKERNGSIGSLELQSEFLIKELNEYGLKPNTLNLMTLYDATKEIMLKYEKPKNQSEAAIKRRYAYAQTAYKELSGAEKTEGIESDSKLDKMQVLAHEYINVAFDVIKGRYGNGKTRRDKLAVTKFDYDTVQEIVNRICEIERK